MRVPKNRQALTFFLGFLLAWSAISPPALAEDRQEPREPWTLDRVLGLPKWVHLFFTQRTRFESMRNQFRPIASGDDRALSLRTTLLTEFRIKRVALGFELADSRVYLADNDTPLNSTLINPLDFLQAYVGLSASNVFAQGAELRLRAGRQTMDLGSRRLVARNRFRNTLNTFSGLNVEWTSRQQDHARLFASVPVRRRPNIFDALAGNEVESDTELSSSLFWGLFYGSRHWPSRLRAEAYLLGLHEEDDDDVPTSDRDFVTPGFRILRAAQPGRFDFEVETAFQTGSSRLTPLPSDVTDLRHRAFFAHGALGYTFSGAWQPRVVVMYDYASGDRDPSDDVNGRFDTLFGARRFEFGPTGIYGALGRSNINSPAIRVDIHPHRKIHAAMAYRPAWLAEARDFWTTTLLRDPTGSSGTFLGHQIEGAARWQILSGNLMLEGGFAYLRLGEFPKQVPRANPDAGNPIYFYLQVGFKI